MNIVVHRSLAIVWLASAPFLTLAAFAAPSLPSTPQPVLSAVAEPYADDLRKAGIRMLHAGGKSARVRMQTEFGSVYFRYPAGLSPVEFVLRVDLKSVSVDSDTYTPATSAQYEAAIKAVLPEAIRRANDENRVMTMRRWTH